ncbi:hypothetical protein EOD41_18895 [Mucilaginibacter limnophilus]|uniref:Uncharacterized protein n=1 Tax=Mucilaginibacter limnophilus TaxID=1932778 RepID=A0A3S3TEK5_9SPHI|nr:hypothetical protein [Mucilaginibacter limnophilus]RVT97364.1 hypothetical protein EOD41_18895 [Mucilaginibacter limnophilus]
MAIAIHKKYIYLIPLMTIEHAAYAQQNPALAKKIGSLFNEEKSFQFTAQAMSKRGMPEDSLKRQDSLEKAVFI